VIVIELSDMILTVIKIFLIFVLINLLPVNILTVCFNIVSDFQPLAILSVRSFCNSGRCTILTVIKIFLIFLF
jgi:hypothetical protein